jgi:translation initiation factor IF-3
VNAQIKAKTVRLIAVDGTQVGIVPLDDALHAAREKDLDLVEVSPQAEHPVCRIMDYGKLRYTRSKKGKTKTRTSHLKEIKLRPLIAEHDVGVKIKNIRKFLSRGDKVRVHMVFRGRERSHTDLGIKLLDEIAAQIDDIGVVETAPTMEVKDMSMLIVPK